MEPLAQNTLGHCVERVAIAGRDSNPDSVLSKCKNILTDFLRFVSPNLWAILLRCGRFSGNVCRETMIKKESYGQSSNCCPSDIDRA